MATISAAEVKKLRRDATGAGMMDYPRRPSPRPPATSTRLLKSCV